MTQFLASFLMVAAAEMGDKTQLLVVAFATQNSLASVIGGVALGILATNLLAAIIGTGVGVALPLAYIRLAAGVLFLVFAAWTLWDASAEEESGGLQAVRTPLAVAGAFFVAELGDKTQLAALALAAKYRSFLSVWLGASIGMSVAIGIAVLIGFLAGRKLPERLLKYASAAIFAIFGAMTIATALQSF